MRSGVWNIDDVDETLGLRVRLVKKLELCNFGSAGSTVAMYRSEQEKKVDRTENIHANAIFGGQECVYDVRAKISRGSSYLDTSISGGTPYPGGFKTHKDEFRHC